MLDHGIDSTTALSYAHRRRQGLPARTGGLMAHRLADKVRRESTDSLDWGICHTQSHLSREGEMP